MIGPVNLTMTKVLQRKEKRKHKELFSFEKKSPVTLTVTTNEILNMVQTGSSASNDEQKCINEKVFVIKQRNKTSLASNDEQIQRPPPQKVEMRLN